MKNLLALLLLASCGKVQSSYTDFVQQRDQLVCDAQARCHCPSACAVTNPSLVRATEDAIAGGAIGFNSSNAALCLDGLRGGLASCTSDASALHGNLQICASAALLPDGGVPLALALGMPCTRSVDCQSGFCDPAPHACGIGTNTNLLCMGEIF